MFNYKHTLASMSSSNMYSATSKELMQGSFATRVQQLTGDLMRCSPVAIFMHMITCAQCQFTKYCVLNWVYLVVPIEVLPMYHSAVLNQTSMVYP